MHGLQQCVDASGSNITYLSLSLCEAAWQRSMARSEQLHPFTHKGLPSSAPFHSRTFLSFPLLKGDLLEAVSGLTAATRAHSFPHELYEGSDKPRTAAAAAAARSRE